MGVGGNWALGRVVCRSGMRKMQFVRREPGGEPLGGTRVKNQNVSESIHLPTTSQPLYNVPYLPSQSLVEGVSLEVRESCNPGYVNKPSGVSLEGRQ